MRSLILATAALAVLPAAAAARPPEPPPAGCVETTQFVLCADDVPQVIADPGGTVNRIVCYGDVRICE
jgi:hypothetical protein